MVYPALGALPAVVLRGLPSPPAPARNKAPSRHGELAGLRAFRAGDDPRGIHWRSSARRGILLVREHEDDEGHEATIVFDNDAHAGAEPFELAVSRTAALCVELARRGLAVGLCTRGGEVAPSVGPGHLARLLRLLAFIAPEAGAPPRPRRRAGAHVRPDGEIDLPGDRLPRGAGPQTPPVPGVARRSPAGGPGWSSLMRFQAAHKLVTYLLVLSALAALGTTRAVCPVSALVFLVVCALSFGVDAGTRAAAALDRAAGPVRAATVSCWW